MKHLIKDQIPVENVSFQQTIPPAIEDIIELSIIVPTFNERDNIIQLINRLRDCLEGIAWEVIFVDDDSSDGTAGVVRTLARLDRSVRCIQRIGRRGLSSACIEGMLASSAPYLAVMDADMQHDETLLPQMLSVLQQGEADVVVGSRYVGNGSLGQLSESRAFISRFATKLSRLVLQAELADPMSGFFMIKRDALHTVLRRLSAIGFKLLLDLFASSPRPLRFKELPYEFRPRQAGTSKLDGHAVWDYLMLLTDKMIGHIVPLRFVSFTLVGGVGVLLHLSILSLLFRGLGVDFVVGQTVATLIAMTGNFFLNNILTYRDMRLKGWEWVRGWLAFVLICSVGMVANVGVAASLFRDHRGWLLSAIAGVFIGAVWNYAVSAVYTWKQPKSI
jgi:dolichol-phosphate mannosyltransferase